MRRVGLGSVRVEGRRRVLPPVIEVQVWFVLVWKDGELTDLLHFTCEQGSFGAAMSDAGYDITDLTVEYTRERG